MKIAVLSGKGGTGKTFVATNLAAISQEENPKGDLSLLESALVEKEEINHGKSHKNTSIYIDCDVEEPNGHLFLKPENIIQEEIFTYIPHFNSNLCTACKKCVTACRFNALVFIKKAPMLFADICHGCGACELVCEAGAVSAAKHSVGFVAVGNRSALQVITGTMHTGEVSAVPVIKKTLEKGFCYSKNMACKARSTNNSEENNPLKKNSEPFIVIDCPPGSACSVMESVQESDFCILVVEPTAFGVHNFKMVYELVSLLEKNCGVVVNKFPKGEIYQPLEDFCQEQNIPILARFEEKPSIAKITSDAKIAVHFDAELAKQFQDLYKSLQNDRENAPQKDGLNSSHKQKKTSLNKYESKEGEISL